MKKESNRGHGKKKMEKMLMSRTFGVIKQTEMMEYSIQERIITENTTGKVDSVYTAEKVAVHL